MCICSFGIFLFLYFCYFQVYLDSESSSVYGLMVTGMEVTDTRDQSEPILVNGSDLQLLHFHPFHPLLSISIYRQRWCWRRWIRLLQWHPFETVYWLVFIVRCSVDPYLFENFETSDGDFLKAKFRAFKFPQSPFVLFKVISSQYRSGSCECVLECET